MKLKRRMIIYDRYESQTLVRAGVRYERILKDFIKGLKDFSERLDKCVSESQLGYYHPGLRPRLNLSYTFGAMGVMDLVIWSRFRHIQILSTLGIFLIPFLFYETLK